MFCPFCHADNTKVLDSRLVAEGNQVWRRRECSFCKERFTTYETAELVMPKIIKRNGQRTPFDEQKLRQGMNKALEKRPVSVEEVEAAINRVMHKLRSTGEREVSASLLGESVMEELRSLDEVAFVRFASVYRRFEDVNAFRDEIKRLKAAAKFKKPQQSNVNNEK